MDWHHFPAMGTTISVLGSAETTDSVRVLFEEFEQRLSRFRPDSELNRINSCRDAAVSISPTMADVLAVAAIARERSEGLVDPAAASRVGAFGYDRTFFDVVDLIEEPEVIDVTGELGWQVTGRVLHRRPGVALDLGGIAKGWAADMAVSETDAWAVNAGGDLRSRHPDLTVEIHDPWDGVAATMPIGVGGLATSSVARRSWRVAGRRVSHLMDPRTGRPVSSAIVQATAIAATAAEAETAAKTLILHGAGALTWASHAEWVRSGLVVWGDGSIYATRDAGVAA